MESLLTPEVFIAAFSIATLLVDDFMVKRVIRNYDSRFDPAIKGFWVKFRSTTAARISQYDKARWILGLLCAAMLVYCFMQRLSWVGYTFASLALFVVAIDDASVKDLRRPLTPDPASGDTGSPE